MPIVFDAASTAIGSTAASTVSVVHQASGSNRAVLVVAARRGTTSSLTELRWAGSTITPVLVVNNIIGTSQIGVVVAVVTNPTTASTTAEVQWAIAPTILNSISVISYGNVNQTTPYDSTAAANGNTSNATITLASTDGGWPFATFTMQTSQATTGTGTIERTRSSNPLAVHSAGDEASSGSVIINWAFPAANQWSGGGFVLRPAAATSRAPQLIWMD